MNTATFTLENIDADILAEALTTLGAGEHLDTLVEALLRRFADTRNVSDSAAKVKVERAVAKAFGRAA